MLRHVPRDITSTRSESFVRDDDTHEQTDSPHKRLGDDARAEADSVEKDTPKPKIWSMAEIATSSKNDSPLKVDNLAASSSTSLSSPSSRVTTSPPPGFAAAAASAAQTLYQSKLPSAHAPMLHPAWRTAAAHPYFQAHMLQSRLAAFANHPAHRLPTNPFQNIAMTSPLRPPTETRVSSAFVPVGSLSKTQS